MENRRILSRGLVCLAIAAMPSCGGSGGGSPTAAPPITQPPRPSRSVLTLSTDPNPIIVTHNTTSNSATFPWRADWTAVFTETAGLGGNIDFIHVNFVNLAGFESRNVVNYGASRIAQVAGTNDYPASGNLRVPMAFVYRSGNVGGTRTITLTIAAQAHDQAGNVITMTDEVRAVFEGNAVRLE
jgi:hypothetical protein